MGFFQDLTWELAVEFLANWCYTRPCSKLTFCCISALQTIFKTIVHEFLRQSGMYNSQRCPQSMKCVDKYVCIVKKCAPGGYIINFMLQYMYPNLKVTLIRAGTTCTAFAFSCTVQFGYPVYSVDPARLMQKMTTLQCVQYARSFHFQV